MKTLQLDRRQFVRLAGYGGIVAASSLTGFGRWARAAGKAPVEDFSFVQLSDTHWGFNGPALNLDAAGTLPKAVAAVNALTVKPDFAVFTGDLTHTTDDPAERRKRLGEFKAIVANLQVPVVRFMPGEHDASLDRGEAYREFFGDLHYTFDHKGIHFIVLDNVSDPAATLGDDQMQWLAKDLEGRDRAAPLVVLTHRPLFDLAPTWDWATRDGARAIDLLMPFEYVTVFYGHIHQEHAHMTGHIAHHAAKGLMYALPAPLSVPKKAPIPWDPAAPYHGLGFREVRANHEGEALAIDEQVVRA